MGKLSDHLNKQLKTEYKQDAEDCLKIYDKLLELDGKTVWSSQWQILVDTKIMGGYPSYDRIYKPSKIGYIFLKGINQQ